MIIEETNSEKKNILGKDIPVGTIFIGEVDNFPNLKYFIRGFSVILSLEDPQKQWSISSSYTVKVKNYQPVEAKLVIL